MKDKISMIVFILVLGAVLTSALVAVDSYTAGPIEANKAYKIKTRVLSALGILYAEDDTKAEFDKSFDENVTVKEIAVGEEIEGKKKKFYISKDGNVAFQIDGKGLWGNIEGVLALQSDRKTIKGLTIIHQEETPGLGGRISEESFLNSFKGKEFSPTLVITKPNSANAENEIDGITGATLTCNAFQKMINSQAVKYIALLGKGN